jgi:hypothetical protein
LAAGSFRRTLFAMWIATLLVVCSLCFPFTGLPAAHAADGVWTEIPPSDFRIGHSAVYDRVRHRMIVFGGNTGQSERNDVWVFELSYPNRWRRLIPSGTPPSPRRNHTAVYDIVHDRMLVFGGGFYDGAWHLDGQVWALELAGEAHWAPISAVGPPPPERYGAVAVYDALRNRMLVHGGISAGAPATVFGDLWALDFDGTPTWTLLAANLNSGPRVFAAAILDSLRDRMVVMGGVSSSFSLNDTWTMPLGNPTAAAELTTLGTPPYTYGHAADYDPLHDQMIVLGGVDTNTQQYLQGVWRLRFGTPTPTWSRGPLSGPIPPPSYFTAGIYDPKADAFRTFGGWGGHPSSVNQDVWTLWLHPSPNWGAPYTVPSPPATGRLGAAVAYDAVHRRMIMFGGATQWVPLGPQYLNDVWLLDLVSPNPAWTPLEPIGTPPDGRQHASLVYDPSGDRVILYGGEGDGSRFPDAWSLSLSGTSAWTLLTPSGTPPVARSRHGAIYDPLRDRMVIFGGGSLIAPYYQSDVWTLSLSGAPAWAQLSPTGTPPLRRQGLSAVLDAAHDRMLVFGGMSDLLPLPANDVWALSLAGATAWDSIEVAPGPSGRGFQVGVHDPVRDRLLVFGGYADPGGGPIPSNQQWALSLAGSPAWTELHPDGIPDPDAEAAAIYDAAGDRMIKYGGFGSINGTWIYQPGAVLDAPSPVAELGPEAPFRATPNPSRGPVELSFVLPVGGRAQLRVYDISGRQVAQVLDATLPAGTHAAHWNGQIAGRAAPAGVYFGRLDHARGVWTTRLLLIR